MHTLLQTEQVSLLVLLLFTDSFHAFGFANYYRKKKKKKKKKKIANHIMRTLTKSVILVDSVECPDMVVCSRLDVKQPEKERHTIREGLGRVL